MPLTNADPVGPASRGSRQTRHWLAQDAGRIYATRLYVRRPVDVRVKLFYCSGGETGVVYARSVDISSSGAGLTLSGELAVGTDTVLCLRLPGSDHQLLLRARVVRRRGFRAGLRFLRPTAEQRLRLCEFCCV